MSSQIMSYRKKTVFKMVRRAALACLVGVGVLAAPLHHSDSVFSAAHAQKQKKQKPKGKRTETLSKAAYDIIIKAQEALQVGTPEQEAVALAQVNKILSNCSKYKPYDCAVAHQTRGYIFANQDNYKASAQEFEAALSSGKLADYTALDLRYNLAQLYLGMEQYKKAIRSLEIWFSKAENPGADALFLAAQAYALDDRLNEAMSYAERGMAKATEPKENWYRLTLAIYLELEKFNKALPLLEKMVSYWPTKKEYFSQLGAIYQEKNRNKESFAVLALAYDNNLLTKSDEFVRLAQLYRYYDYPYKGAKIIEKEIKAGRIKKNKKNWEELGMAWMQAREHKKALQPLANAARKAKDGDIYLLLCQTYFQDEKYGKAARNCRNAVNKGGLKSNGGIAYQLLGIALDNQGKEKDAAKAFERCLDWKSTEKDCRRWVKHINAKIEFARKEEERKAAAEADAQARAKQQEEDIKRVLHQKEEFSESLDQ